MAVRASKGLVVLFLQMVRQAMLNTMLAVTATGRLVLTLPMGLDMPPVVDQVEARVVAEAAAVVPIDQPRVVVAQGPHSQSLDHLSPTQVAEAVDNIHIHLAAAAQVVVAVVAATLVEPAAMDLAVVAVAVIAVVAEPAARV